MGRKQRFGRADFRHGRLFPCDELERVTALAVGIFGRDYGVRYRARPYPRFARVGKFQGWRVGSYARFRINDDVRRCVGVENF